MRNSMEIVYLTSSDHTHRAVVPEEGQLSSTCFLSGSACDNSSLILGRASVLLCWKSSNSNKVATVVLSVRIDTLKMERHNNEETHEVKTGPRRRRPVWGAFLLRFFAFCGRRQCADAKTHE